jgi:hypothetical protein
VTKVCIGKSSDPHPLYDQRLAVGNNSDMQANGFSAVVDPPPLDISEENIAPLSLPQEVFTFTPGDAELISKFSGADQERKIHCNLELRPDELERLKLLRDEANEKGRTYYTSITVMATRYMSYARGNADKAIAMMDETQKWRSEYFGKGPLADSKLIEDFSQGVLYFTGRDFALRPVLVIRACRLPAAWHKDGTGVTRLIKMLVFSMEYLRRYMFVPGKVENIVVLVDLKNLGIADVPIKSLKAIYSVLSHHYIVRVFRFYIVNMSYMLSSLVSVVKPILTDRQRQKLCFLKNVNECREWIALHQLEEDLGGSRPVVTKFFPFPLLPGPFTSGCSDGPRTDAVQNCHRALTAEGFRGHLWDSSKSEAENTQYEYTEFAEDIFKACGLPIPPNCPVRPKEPEPVEAASGQRKNVVSLDDLYFPPRDSDKENIVAPANSIVTSVADKSTEVNVGGQESQDARADQTKTGTSGQWNNIDSMQTQKPGDLELQEKEQKKSEQKKCCAACAIM